MTNHKMIQQILGIGLLVVLAAMIVGCGNGTDSGATVLVPKDGSGSIRVRLVFNAGSAYDPAGKEGLAQFTANALRRGSTEYSRKDIDNTLDALAARLTIDVAREVTVIEGVCLTESWPEFSTVLFSILTEPAFDSQEMTSLVSDQLDEIEQIRRDDADLAQAALQYYLYRNHPYGHPPAGFSHAVESFTVQDARTFYRDHFTRSNYTLGLAGDVSDTLAEAIHAVLGTVLPEGEVVPPPLPTPSIAQSQVYLIEKENRTQTQLRFGRPVDMTRQDADFMPLHLFNSYLGRHRESMGLLYREIRTARGFSYGAYSYAEHFDQDGWSKLARPGRSRRQQYVSAWVYPKAVNANFVIHIVMKLLTDLKEKGLTPEQLESTRTFEINHFPFEIETPRRLLGMRMDEIAYQTPGFVDRFADRARAVTVDDVKRAIDRAIDPNSMVIVAVVSDGQKFASELISDQILYEYPSGVDARNLREADKPYLNFPLGIDAENVRVVKAEEMFR